MEVKDDSGEIISDNKKVINRWKIDYEALYSSSDNTGLFNEEHFEDVKAKLRGEYP